VQSLITIIASSIGIWAVFKYIILIEIRIDENSFKVLYNELKFNKKFVLEEEFTNEYRYPVVYRIIGFIKNCPLFYLSHEERLMSAGFESKDYVNRIASFRWNYKKIKNYIKEVHKTNTDVSVDLLLPGYSDRIGQIRKINFEPIITNQICKDFESDVKTVIEKKKLKTSAIFYGPPGNGKTTFVKYLSIKYDLPIKVITLSPDWNNHDLLVLFSQIPKNCIVLLEDFDNYFEGRKCIVGGDNKNIKFTFDILLNSLDGLYTTYDGVVFIMTTNSIDKIDGSLKNRPSRFKYIINFINPEIEIRKKILNSEEYAKKTENLSLDQVFKVKEFVDSGLTISESLDRIYLS
jgi:hypothetical protein